MIIGLHNADEVALQRHIKDMKENSKHNNKPKQPHRDMNQNLDFMKQEEERMLQELEIGYSDL